MENCCWFVFTVFVFKSFWHPFFVLSVLENLRREKVKTNCRLIGQREVCLTQITQIWVVTSHQYGIISALVVRCNFLGTPEVASWSVGGYLRLQAKNPFRDSTSASYIKKLHNVFAGHLQSCLPWLAMDQGDKGKTMDVRGSDGRKLMKLTLLDAEKE